MTFICRSMYTGNRTQRNPNLYTVWLKLCENASICQISTRNQILFQIIQMYCVIQLWLQKQKYLVFNGLKTQIYFSQFLRLESTSVLGKGLFLTAEDRVCSESSYIIKDTLLSWTYIINNTYTFIIYLLIHTHWKLAVQHKSSWQVYRNIQ